MVVPTKSQVPKAKTGIENDLAAYLLEQKDVLEKFWQRIHKTNTCWLWLREPNRDGYGKFNISVNKIKYQFLAHRFSYFLHIGYTELNVLHKCDVPACVNPTHLYEGTQEDNLRDALDRGRFPIGTQRWNAKLTEANIREIRALCGILSQTEIAKKFGIQQPEVSRILNGLHWSHV